jgi:hypothetical protein
MTKSARKLASVSVLGLALASQAMADIKLNDSVSVSGYVAGSYQYTKPTGGTSSDHFDVDSSQLLFKYTSAPVTGVASLYYVPGQTPDETALLDAYATYDVGGGYSITGGKFLSPLGYESFFVVNNPTISYANGAIGAIPGYHSGLKFDYSDKDWGFGGAILDSVYGATALKGDGELANGQGYEGYVTYKGVSDLTIFAGAAFDNSSPVTSKDVAAYDIWASYKVDAKTTVAAEYAARDGGGRTDKGSNWLFLANYSFTDKVNTAFRISGEKDNDAGSKYVKYTVAPGIALTKELTVRAEYSYTDGSSGAKNSNFVGVQAYLKF